MLISLATNKAVPCAGFYHNIGECACKERPEKGIRRLCVPAQNRGGEKYRLLADLYLLDSV
jgi:hypothetical protein